MTITTTMETTQAESVLRGKLRELSSRSGLEDIVIERSPDELDNIQNMGNREAVINDLNRRTRLMHSIRAALDRIAVGDYGTCLSCDQEIPRRRLVALPWAENCVPCQEAIDRRQKEELAFGESGDWG